MARLSEKVEAAGMPDPNEESGRYSHEGGCHEVTGIEIIAKKKLGNRRTFFFAASMFFEHLADADDAGLMRLVRESCASFCRFDDTAMRVLPIFGVVCPAAVPYFSPNSSQLY